MKSILTRNNVKIGGHGTRPLMFAHGFGCDQNMWRFVAPAFEADYRVILFDYVGAGNSDLAAYDPKRYETLDGYALDVVEICDALGVRDGIFVGHSVSAMIGTLAALERPELFARLVFVSPSPCYINHPPDYVGGFEREDIEGLLDMMERNFIGWAQQLAPAVMKNEDRPELGAELEKSFCSTDPDIARRFARATFYSDNRADLARLPRPSLIVQVTDDAIAPREVGDFMHRLMPASVLRHLEASGHCPHLSHPRETIAIIKEYLGDEAPG